MTCETCKNCRRLFWRSGYDFKMRKESFCVIGEEFVEQDRACGEWAERTEQKEELLSRLQRADRDVRALLEIFKK